MHALSNERQHYEKKDTGLNNGQKQKANKSSEKVMKKMKVAKKRT